MKFRRNLLPLDIPHNHPSRVLVNKLCEKRILSNSSWSPTTNSGNILGQKKNNRKQYILVKFLEQPRENLRGKTNRNHETFWRTFAKFPGKNNSNNGRNLGMNLMKNLKNTCRRKYGRNRVWNSGKNSRRNPEICRWKFHLDFQRNDSLDISRSFL